MYMCLFSTFRGVGCIFAELLNRGPLLPGKVEMEQLNLIFKVHTRGIRLGAL
jgi:hypothetical protein